jgi:hypothetical protein
MTAVEEIMNAGMTVSLSPNSPPARSTPVGAPLLRSDPSAAPLAGERETGSLREFHLSKVSKPA